jgi:hypothetical protein
MKLFHLFTYLLSPHPLERKLETADLRPSFIYVFTPLDKYLLRM